MRRANGSVIATKHKHKHRFCVEAMLFYITQISDFNNNTTELRIVQGCIMTEIAQFYC
jgi:hypothetical protein